MNTLQVGQKVHSKLYGGRNGIIYQVHGSQSPESVRQLGGGAVVMGGTADFDIVFEDGSISFRVPEGIVLGCQWRIGDEVASQQDIDKALAYAEACKVKADGFKKLKAEAQAKEKERILKEYPDLEQGDDDAVIVAKNIKTELKKAFPKIKFSVRSDYFTNGSSVHIKWVDGPTQEEVQKITYKYKSGHFNAMSDCYESNPDNVWVKVFGGADYVSPSRRLSAKHIKSAAEKMGYKIEVGEYGEIIAADIDDDTKNLIRQQAFETSAIMAEILA
jgi:hypothetical protein